MQSGVKPRKNKEVMQEVIDNLKEEGLFYGDKVKVNKDANQNGNAEDSESEAPVKKSK